MINEKRVKEIVKVLIPSYKNPIINDIKIKNEKIFRAQTITESCIVCFVYENHEIPEELSMDHQSPFRYELIFPEYYLTMTDDEIRTDVEERKEDYKNGTKRLRLIRFLTRDKKLNINIPLEVTKEEYNKLIDLIQKSDLSDSIKCIFNKDKWNNAYENLVDPFKGNHTNSIFVED